ncbi:hypothetical protein [Streptomyces acidiscabies]|uniref:Uncharacterized protein n=1 Tax=Streptomyces acidiscabies TaxID=42234 RepID=A0AAP6EL35_9ACTN|nr:hypothetical protein [Streptomyces acidiscabies]MBZ3909403.1 hypothetical protein [Streptomyces acidiscabies]MDX2966633.1 hypothetical protein [Streptomyces acidiscabies]MDX3796603.1 hypothetical protein [Streptomyces acidiscabies]
MSALSRDARAIVDAVNRVKTEVGRLANALQAPVETTPDGPTTPTDDGRVTRLTEMLTGVRPEPDTCRSIEVDGETISVRGSGDFTEQDANFFQEIVRAAKRRYEAEHGTADDEDELRWTRREALGVLLSRAERGVLTTAEAAQLRAHMEAEIRDCNTARKVARGNRDHVRYLAGEIDRLTAELEQAQAAIERVRAVLPYAEQIATTTDPTT